MFSIQSGKRNFVALQKILCDQVIKGVQWAILD
jgi:hypothetical protein